MNDTHDRDLIEQDGPPLASSEADAAGLPNDADAGHGLSPADGPDRSAARRRTTLPSRRLLVVRLTMLALIGLAIWYLQASPTLPFAGRSGGGAAQDGATTGFVTFGSQGIKLGAAGGTAAKIGEPAPEFTLLDSGGNVVRLSDFRGKTVVMNFWATWCSPCRKEFPELIKLYNRNVDRGLVVLGVDLQESPDIVRSFLNEFGATYPVVIDTKGDVAARYRLLGLPTTYFIDGDGIVRAQHVGELTEAILAKKLGETGFTTAGRQ